MKNEPGKTVEESGSGSYVDGDHEEPEPIDPDEAEAFFNESHPQKPRKGPSAGKKRHSTLSPAGMSNWVWGIVSGILMILVLVVGYAYHRYSKAQAARKLLKRAQTMEKGHNYKQALFIISDRLLKHHPSSEAARTGRSLRSRIQNILSRYRQVRTRFNKLKSSLSLQASLSSANGLKQAPDTLDRIDSLYTENERFLKKNFGPPFDPGRGPKLLDEIKELKQSVTTRWKRHTENMLQQKREEIKKRIENREFDRAMEMASEFEQKYNKLRDDASSRLSKLTKHWISEEYRDARKSAQKMIKKGRYDRGINQFKKTMNTFEKYVSEKKLAADLEELKNQDTNTDTVSEKDDPTEEKRNSDRKRNSSVITGEGLEFMKEKEKNDTGSSEEESSDQFSDDETSP